MARIPFPLNARTTSNRPHHADKTRVRASPLLLGTQPGFYVCPDGHARANTGQTPMHEGDLAVPVTRPLSNMDLACFGHTRSAWEEALVQLRRMQA